MSPPPLLLLLLLLLPLSIQTTHSIPTNQSSAALRRPTRHLLSHQPNPLAPYPSPSPSASPPAHAHARAHHHHKKHRARNWVIGFFVGLFSGVLSGVLFSILFRLLVNCIKGNFNKIAGPSIYSPLIKNSDALSFLEKDDALSSLELIGRGGCGEVYRTELPGSVGRMIAIKRVMQPTADALELGPEDNSKLLNKRMRQIRSEINTVGQIRHRNLLPLLAHVTRPECHYLVYEYMKNGSLHDALKGVENGSRVLEWKTRHNIAVGIASGLEYLHMLHRPRIIHRDLKPANILLDDDLEARIADFGLAKAIPDANTHVTTSAVAGTVGYIAPEYHQSLKFTDKSDIYSFGVILAVLVIGRHPSDDFFQATEEMGLVKWLRGVVSSEQPAEAIDPSLRGNGFEEQILLVLKIACFCTADDPTQRPNSKDVRCMLTQIKH